MDSTERRILGFTGISHFFAHFTMLLFPPLATTIARDLGTGLDEVFSVSFLMYLCYGLGAIPWGFISDRWNPRMALASGIILAGAGLAGAGLIRNSAALPFMLAIVGLGNAAYHPAGLALISKGMRSRGRGMGLNGVFGNLGIASAPLMAGLLAWSFGWRSTFIFLGISGIIAGLAIVAVPFTVPRSEDRQRGEVAVGKGAVVLFLLLCGVVLFAGLEYRSFTLILPSWLEGRMAGQFSALAGHFKGLNTAKTGMDSGSLIAALVSSAAMLIGMVGQLAGGRLADRLELKKAYLLFIGLALPCLLAASLMNGWASLPFLGLFTFFVLGMQPIENSLYAMLVPPRWRSSGFGIKFTLAFGVGSLAVTIVSATEKTIGLEGVMLLTAGYLALSVLMAVLLYYVGRRTSIRHLHD